MGRPELPSDRLPLVPSLPRDKGMRHMVGPDWRQLFDVVIVQADKPSFFTDPRKYGPGRVDGTRERDWPLLTTQYAWGTSPCWRVVHMSRWAFAEWGGAWLVVLPQTGNQGLYSHPTLGLSENLMRRAPSSGTVSPAWKRARFIGR